MKGTVHFEARDGIALLSIDNPPVGQVINIVDDNPIRMRDFVELLLPMFGHKPGGMPVWIPSLIAGKPFPEMFSSSFRLRNHRAKAELGWDLQHPDIRDQLPQVVADYKARLRID